MAAIKEKVTQYFQKHTFFAVSMVSMLGILVTAVSVFAMTRDANPHISELSFIEESWGKEGSVIPASCNSAPPTEHFPGDCPPGVHVNISSSLRTVTASMSVDSNYGARLSSGIWYVGNNEDTTDATRPATVHFSSSGATRCWVYSGVWTERATSGSFDITIGPGETESYAIRCTDGVFFSGTTLIQVYGEFNRVRPER